MRSPVGPDPSSVSRAKAECPGRPDPKHCMGGDVVLRDLIFHYMRVFERSSSRSDMNQCILGLTIIVSSVSW